MGKKSGRQSSDAGDTATAFVLKVPMHCRCDGCAAKIRAAVKDLLRCEGILSLDQSALFTKGELAVVATADPERLQRRLRKATGKSVDLVFPKPPAAKPAAVGQQQPVHAHHGHPVPAAAAWSALRQGGYGQSYAYPWVLQQQQQQAPPEPYLASYPAAAYPTAPHDGLGSAYGGGGWFGV